MPEAAAVPARPMKCPDLVMILMILVILVILVILMILVILICCDGDDVDYKINHRRPGPGGDLKHGCMGDDHSIIIILLTLMTYMSLLMTMIITNL